MQYIPGQSENDPDKLELTECTKDEDELNKVVLRPPKESAFSLDCAHDRNGNNNYDYSTDVKWFRNGAEIVGQSGPSGKLLNPIYFDPKEFYLLKLLSYVKI